MGVIPAQLSALAVKNLYSTFSLPQKTPRYRRKTRYQRPDQRSDRNKQPGIIHL